MTFQFLIVFLVQSEFKRLLMSQSQNTEHTEALAQQLVNSFLEQLIEINQDVSAGMTLNSLKELSVAREKTMFSLRDEQNGVVISGSAILRKDCLPPALR